MTIPSRFKVRSIPVLFGLAILFLSVLLFFHKFPPLFIIYKVNETVSGTINHAVRNIKFGIQPGEAIVNQENVPFRPFKYNRVDTTTGPLKVSPVNPRYFSDGSGKVVYLTGSHTWSNLQDNGGSNPPPEFDYDSYLSFLQQNNHNFFRLWVWEQSRWTVETTDDNYWFFPMPYQRTGPGTAIDGMPKFDLTKFNQSYFDRVRQRVISARDRGIYVSIMLFDGWSIEKEKGQYTKNNPWKGHPFNKSNNINGINGDPNGNNSGEETHTLSIPEITELQEAYIRKIIETVNDLDNVLYEISNESNNNSEAWQYHLIDYIHQIEFEKPKQHPVGMTSPWPGGYNPDLFASEAEWISPNNGDGSYFPDPRVADGSKVILADTDHLCGVCGDRVWVWKSFTMGENVIFMDGYDGTGYGVGGEGFNPDDPRWISARLNMGYTLTYANRVNLAAMRPLPHLASTGYILACPNGDQSEYLVYLPNGGKVSVDLSGATGDLKIEWLNPGNGHQYFGGTITGGGNRTFTAPFEGDAVLYLYFATKPTHNNKFFLPKIAK